MEVPGHNSTGLKWGYTYQEKTVIPKEKNYRPFRNAMIPTRANAARTTATESAERGVGFVSGMSAAETVLVAPALTGVVTE